MVPGRRRVHSRLDECTTTSSLEMHKPWVEFVIVVALTGGIGAGKSTVSKMLADKGALCIDADDVSRTVVAPGSPALSEIAATFGPHLIRDGALDRSALARIVFTNEEARAQLNAIVHPRVREQTAKLIEQARRANPGGILVYAIPLLVESESDVSFDAVIAVSASPELRMQRLVDGRGMTPEEAASRIHAQADESERLAAATYVIDTNGTLDHTREQVDALWHKLTLLGPA